MARFYYAGSLKVGESAVLADHIAHHVRVLRLTQGDFITLFNDEGSEHIAVITEIEKSRVLAQVKTSCTPHTELPYAITLAQALPEGSKMDWIIEKAVELGVAAIQPLAAQRCVMRLSEERAIKRREHWQGIVIAASEQSGRTRIAQLASPVNFKDWAQQHDLHLRILLSPRADQTLSDWARHHPPQAIALTIGPEGGFTDAEEAAAQTQGMLPLAMGPRVLRTETAGLAAMAAVNAIWGQM